MFFYHYCFRVNRLRVVKVCVNERQGKNQMADFGNNIALVMVELNGDRGNMAVKRSRGSRFGL